MKITLKKFRHTLDWYSITDREIDTDKFCFFYLECRGAGIAHQWHLCHFTWDEKKREAKQQTHYEFCVSDIREAIVKLTESGKLKGFRFSNNASKQTVDDLMNILPNDGSEPPLQKTNG